jgi:hypothetical protein
LPARFMFAIYGLTRIWVFSTIPIPSLYPKEGL